MNPHDALVQKIPEIEKTIGYTFTDRAYLIRAFIHSSFLNEYKTLQLKHNERLEFLGDSVLNLVVAEYLFRILPDISEGELSALRGHIVSANSCIEFIQKLGVQGYVLVGKGEQMNTLRGKTSILADLFEAVLGAIYLDGGLQKVRDFFLSHFAPIIEGMLQKPHLNFKALLQEYIQKTRRQIPLYRVIEESGPDHEKNFQIGVYIEDTLIGQGRGTSKKEAEQAAAKVALSHLQEPRRS